MSQARQPGHVNLLSGMPVDRLGHRRGDDAWLAKVMESAGARFLPTFGSSNLVRMSDPPRPAFLSPQDLRRLGLDTREAVLLGTREDRHFFSIRVTAEGDFTGELAFKDLRWSADMQLIGEMYAIYRRSMENWHKTLPEGTILDVQYEQLVEDPETHARRMIDACGLEWDPTVLEFFRKKSVVRTASIAQTRQPIYKTSRARWINYARHVQPLVTQLAPYLQDDRELLEEHGLELPSGGWLKRLMG